MPAESVDLITYYNIFEYVYPVCLLTVAATLVYAGYLILKGRALLSLASGFTTFIFALFLFPTFLHAINHVTDEIENTMRNNALNWFGVIGIPLILLLGWLSTPGRTVFGCRRAEVASALKQVLEKLGESAEERGRFRLRSEKRTYYIVPLLDRPVVFTWYWKSPFADRASRVFDNVEAILVGDVPDDRPENVKAAAFTLFVVGLLLGALSFISWATSVLMVNPAWREYRP